MQDILSKLSPAANVRVHDILVTDEGLIVTLKANFPGETSLRAAHDAMTDLERSLKLSFPDVVRVHVDPKLSLPSLAKKSPTVSAINSQGVRLASKLFV